MIHTSPPNLLRLGSNPLTFIDMKNDFFTAFVNSLTAQTVTNALTDREQTFYNAVIFIGETPEELPISEALYKELEKGKTYEFFKINVTRGEKSWETLHIADEGLKAYLESNKKKK